ncbi:hypothetical protein CEXT_282151 [Caerostris extrusa]|uniref:Uncharacterized protein n=1 Tax=Caerostris extrusa TaxID=172846 RepID=A0AAV4R5T0_CAEEX|nr:hypothetical protein CEXT_282151 [Caerostris extrusa]
MKFKADVIVKDLGERVVPSSGKSNIQIRLFQVLSFFLRNLSTDEEVFESSWVGVEIGNFPLCIHQEKRTCSPSSNAGGFIIFLKGDGERKRTCED